MCEDSKAVIAEAVGRCAVKPLMVAVGATAYLGVPRALAAQGWLADAALVTVGAVQLIGHEIVTGLHQRFKLRRRFNCLFALATLCLS